MLSAGPMRTGHKKAVVRIGPRLGSGSAAGPPDRQRVVGADLPFRGALSVQVMAMRLLVANGKGGGWRLHPALVAGGVYGRISGSVKKREG
ncbi:MAG: hypothetical protein WD736_07270 [Chloroflexota bacterium]